MKNKILLKSLFLFALVFTISSFAYASEVTGTLSSTGKTSTSTTTSGSPATRTSSNGSSGTVTGGNIPPSVSGSRVIAQSTGSVLGASVTGENSQNVNLTATDNAPQDGTTGSTTTTTTSTLTPSVDAGSQTAEAMGASGFGFNSWFWTILILLVLVLVTVYLYRRSPLNRKKLNKI